MQTDDIDNRFTYHAPAPEQIPVYEEIRGHGRPLARRLNELLPESREKSLAVTKLEEGVFWANAALARHGLPAPKDS